MPGMPVTANLSGPFLMDKQGGTTETMPSSLIGRGLFYSKKYFGSYYDD